MKGRSGCAASAAIAAAILASACAGPPAVHREPVYAALDFEGASYSPWNGQYASAPGNFDFSSTDPYEGSLCGKFSLGEGGDYWLSPATGIESARSELEARDYAPSGSTVFYSWALKIDESYVESEDWQVIGQFHDRPDEARGETWDSYPARSPPLAFKYRSGSLVVAAYSWDSGGVIDLASAPIEKGRWHRIAARVRWSAGRDGEIEAWLDGVPIESPDGRTTYAARNCFNEAGNYLKIGLYRSMAIGTEATVYFDDVKSGPTPDYLR